MLLGAQALDARVGLENRINHKDQNEMNVVRGDERLHQFEIASLINLLPADQEEAETLIPSLTMPGKDLSEQDIESMLQELRKNLPME